ncbi:MAG: UTP--glucose-1-phosphate uridylyltransferase [Candidatus Peregrinibacteria bacterium Gr01-1014_25]|nr:MAG: UTP--glucose-1-phosphate uridylyltransferase [Candidatus Peregrinibacteria bacterium Gr01-1014_25]
MKITQAILPVAGLGTRFLPWTKVVPKELLPIGSQPIIAHLVDECISIGIDDICFVISRGKEMIPQYFYAAPALEHELKRRGKHTMLDELKRYDTVRLHVVYQEDQLGDGHAILQAVPWVQSDTIAVLFGDDIIVGDENGLQQLVRAHAGLPAEERTHASVLTLENVPAELTHKYGIADIDPSRSSGRLHRIKGLVEKPAAGEAPSTLGIVGKYLIPRRIFDLLPIVAPSHGGEIRLVDGLIAHLKNGPVYGYEFAGKRYDTGSPEGYKEAVRELG